MKEGNMGIVKLDYNKNNIVYVASNYSTLHGSGLAIF